MLSSPLRKYLNNHLCITSFMSQPYGKIKGFQLPIQTVTIVPCTDKVSKIIPKKQCQIRANEIKSKMVDFFGGYTEIKGQGGYFSNDLNKKVEEPVITVTAFAGEQKFKENKSKWLKFVKDKGEKWGQESMGIIVENDFISISREKKTKK